MTRHDLRAIGRHAHINVGRQAGGRLILSRYGVSKLVSRVRAHQSHRATPKPGARHARALTARLSFGAFHHAVQFEARYFKIVAQTHMAGMHQLP